MKKFLWAIALSLALVGCSSSKSDQQTIQSSLESEKSSESEESKAFKSELKDDGSMVIEAWWGNDYTVKDVPYNNIVVNDSKFALTSVDVYFQGEEAKYIPYVVVKFDLSGLSDDDKYWLFEKDPSNFDLSVTLNSEKNDTGDLDLILLDSSQDESSLLCIYSYIQQFHFDLSDAKTQLSLIVAQNEKASYKNESTGQTIEQNKENTYYWNDLNLEVQTDVPSDIQMNIINGWNRLYEIYTKNKDLY